MKISGTSRCVAIGMVLIAALLSACGGGGSGGGSGSGGSMSSSSSSSSSQSLITVRYKRISQDYTGWGLHIWNTVGQTPSVATATETTWAAPRVFDTVQGGWATTTVPLINASAALNLIVHKGDAKSPQQDLSLIASNFPDGVWIVQGVGTVHASQFAADVALSTVGQASTALDLTNVSRVDSNSGLGADWSKRAQFMEIYVRAYKDSDGDGKGDLKGVISQLDYLKDLGITGIWLMPVFASSDRDHGYAVTDYRSLEADYGTMADLEELITKAHAKGIGIILDYVMNHASSQNPLFLDAVSDASNSKRDWFLWSSTNPGWTGFSGQSWRLGESGYYYGIFDGSMPDFNLRNASVVEFHKNNLRFWLNKGIDGFRFDAVGVLFENGASAWSDQPENHSLLKAVQDEIKAYTHRYMICEAPDNPSAYAVLSSCGGAFAFGRQGDIKSSALNGSLASGLVTHFNSALRASLPLILSNHDSFAGNRPYDELSGNSEGPYRVAAAISILGSDTPFIYYGEEIGMRNAPLSGDAALRSPMSWTANSLNAGFTTGTPFRALSANVTTHNVAAQSGVAGTLHDTYRRLYSVRQNHGVLSNGQLTLKSGSGDSTLIFTRSEGTKVAVVVINLINSPQTVSVSTGLGGQSFAGASPLSFGTLTANGGGALSVTVPAYGVSVYVTP